MTNRRSFLKQAAGAGIVAATLQPLTSLNAADPSGLPRRRAGHAQTVLGPLDASKLGFALTHEHIADGPSVLNRWPKSWGGRAEFVAKVVEKLQLMKAAGVSTVVDLTTYDVGRDIRFLREVSRKAGVHMIASTGQRFFPPRFANVSMPSRTPAGLTKFFTKEIELGIDGTSIKAGVIKIGIVAKVPTTLEETGLRAAARASKATGVPIRIHHDAANRAGENQVAILEEEGVNPARVSFEHSDDSGDMDYYLGLVRRGYSLSMDHVHRGIDPTVKPTFDRRVDCIKLLIDAGFADKVFISQDSEIGGALLPAEVKEWRETIDPPVGLLFVTRELIPHLRSVGVTDADIRRITVENPRRFFGRV